MPKIGYGSNKKTKFLLPGTYFHKLQFLSLNQMDFTSLLSTTFRISNFSSCTTENTLQVFLMLLICFSIINTHLLHRNSLLEIASSVSTRQRKAIIERALQLDVKVINANARLRTEENE